MKRLKLVLGVAALMVAIMAASAAPAAAQTFVSTSGDGFCDGFEDDEDCFFVDGFLVCEDDFDGDFFDGDFFDRDFDGFDFDGDFAREVEQDAESGDIDQDFSVTGTGDNSSQCVGIQGVANTGNAQDAVGLGLLGGDFDDFDIDDSGADIDVSGSADTLCDQEVNQAAAASAW